MATIENQDRRLSGPWWLLMLEGIAAFAFGVLLVINTERTLTVLVGLLGIYLLVVGVLRIISSFHGGADSGWKLLSGVLAIIFGVIIIANRFYLGAIAPVILAYVVAIVFVLDGLIHIVQGFRRPRAGGDYGSPVLGFFELILGVILLIVSSFTATLVVVTLAVVGIVGGLVLFVYAFVLRSQQKGEASPA